MAENSMWFRRTLVIPVLSAYFFLCRLELSSSQALKTFGESCDADCDERQLLTCSKNTSICECMQPHSMLYDKPREKCVGKAGFPCIRYANDFHCVPHASCDRTASSCICDKGYFQTENGTCPIVAKYGDPCSAKRPCDKSSGMTCTEKLVSGGRTKRTCQCMYPTDQYFNATAQSCITYPGGNCSFSWPCVRNAACSVDIYELRQGENIHGKVYTYNATIGKKCACKGGFTKTRDRLCVPTYQQQCDLEASSEFFCNSEENLKCFDSSICLCKSPLSQIYDWSSSKCVKLLGADCKPTQEEGGGGEGDDDKNEDDAECSSNAECSGTRRKCECKAGFSSTPFSTCLKDFGRECSGSDGGKERCNIHRGLACHQIRGSCGCIDDDTLKYDTNTKTCLSEGEGGGCGTFEYLDGIGFVLGGNIGDNSAKDFRGGEVVMMVMMGNHKRGMVMGRGGNTLQAASYNGSFPLSVTTSGSSSKTKEKVFHDVTKIHIKCGSGLECVNEFEEMENGIRGENNIFRGVCRYKRG